MKNYLRNTGKYYIFILVIVFFLGIAIGTNYIVTLKKGFTIESKAENIYKNNYKMEINYPVFNNKKVNKKIENNVQNEKDKFLNTIDKNANHENELNVNYNYSIKDKVYSVHLRTYSYTGNDSDYYRNDEILYFDQNTNKTLKIDELILDDEFYNILIDESTKYLKNQKNVELYDKEQFEEAINNKENYKLLIFSEKKVYVVFIPHTVSPYDGEINIDIQYDVLKEYLNTDYFTTLKENNLSKKNDTTKKVKRIRDYKQFTGKKLVAITFDDGPAYSKTETLLTEFEKRNVRASFFLLGENASKQEELVKKMYDYGHTIGSHTYDHKNLKKLDDEQLKYEIDYTNEILSGIIGEEIKFLRPPYGSYDQNILSKTDMSFILWSVDTLDWKLRDSEKVAQFMAENVNDGDIVLLHDIHAETIDGAIKGIDLLKEQNFEFVSLEELIEYRKINIEKNKAYRHFKIVKEDEDIVNTDKIDEK